MSGDGEGPAVDLAQSDPVAEAAIPAAVPRLPDCQVAIVGAGPAGLATAVDLHLRGIRQVLVFDQAAGVQSGSRAFWWSRRSLEIFARLGAEVGGGATWRSSHVIAGERELYRYDVTVEAGHRLPPFVDLGQDRVEAALRQRLSVLGAQPVAWRHRLVGIEPREDRVLLAFSTPEGERSIEALHVVAADGSHSAVRGLLGLNLVEPGADEAAIVVDARLASENPLRRRLWLRPPFHDGPAAGLHPLPEGLARIELQLDPEAVPAVEAQPARLLPRLQRMLGGIPEIVWAGVHAVRPGWLRHFVHGRVIFVGDAAHIHPRLSGVGANGGIEDADNLAWKLALVIQDRAPADLLDSYDAERAGAAGDAILLSSRAADFVAPAPGMATRLRDAVLELATSLPFARTLIAVGRLPHVAVFESSTLNGPDELGEPRLARPGAVCPDAPVRLEDGGVGQLLDRLGEGFTVIHFLPRGGEPSPVYEASVRWGKQAVPVRVLRIGDGAGRLGDVEGLVAARLAGAPGAVLVIRPDQRVLARFARFDAAVIEAALARGLAHPGGNPWPPSSPAPAAPSETSKEPAG